MVLTYHALISPKNIPFSPIYNLVVRWFDQFSVEKSIRRSVEETENGILTDLKTFW